MGECHRPQVTGHLWDPGWHPFPQTDPPKAHRDQGSWELRPCPDSRSLLLAVCSHAGPGGLAEEGCCRPGSLQAACPLRLRRWTAVRVQRPGGCRAHRAPQPLQWAARAAFLLQRPWDTAGQKRALPPLWPLHLGAQEMLPLPMPKQALIVLFSFLKMPCNSKGQMLTLPTQQVSGAECQPCFGQAQRWVQGTTSMTRRCCPEPQQRESSRSPQASPAGPSWFPLMRTKART